jgi:putative transport protein
MNWLVTSLRENPELAIFLTLAIGFVIGRIRFGSFSLGNVVGTLLAGVVVGQLAIEIDPIVKLVFFDLFLFATGYKVGPQFFRGLRKNAGSQALHTMLRPGDVAVVGARRHVLLGAGAPFGTEVEDRELLDVPMAALDVVVTRREIAERPLAEVAEEHGRGVVLLKLVRAGEEIPFAPDTVLNRGDLLRLAGSERDVERAGEALGYVERPSSATDVVFVGLGILLGGLFGALTLQLGDLPISLTASGGALIMGLVFGWLRSVRPTFGRIPEPALWVFDTIGLAVFIGCVGLGAGPSFVAGLRETGPSLLVVSLVVALVPHTTAVLFGRYVLKMNPVLLLGACSGAGTATAALRAVQDEAGSKLPVLGYTVPYAIGNILLTAWGPVIVMLTR